MAMIKASSAAGQGDPCPADGRSASRDVRHVVARLSQLRRGAQIAWSVARQQRFWAAVRPSDGWAASGPSGCATRSIDSGARAPAQRVAVSCLAVQSRKGCGWSLMAELELLEPSVWSIASGRGSEDDVARLHADENASRRLLDRLILEAESDLASVRSLPDDVRDQVVADFTETLAALRATASRLRSNSNGAAPSHSTADTSGAMPPAEIGEVQLQASWSSGQVVVWAAGRGAPP